MRSFFGVLIYVFVPVFFIYPQKHFGPDKEMREKMAQLERIKLIEVMEMDEETTLRFFSRRAEFQKKQEELRQEVDLTVDKLEAALKSAGMMSEAELQNMINRINELQLSMEQRRIDFINSLEDILSKDKIARYVVFEKRFKEEIKNMLLRGPKPREKD
jgi:ElaB/YqjD/DUF883 family membrane-anchored ribosome-binding protein